VPNNNRLFEIADIMTIKDVCAHLGVSRVTLYRWIKDPKMNFPEPIRLNTRQGWRKEDIDQWIKALSS
jgi:excisionase family DNA binding protein